MNAAVSADESLDGRGPKVREFGRQIFSQSAVREMHLILVKVRVFRRCLGA